MHSNFQQDIGEGEKGSFLVRDSSQSFFEQKNGSVDDSLTSNDQNVSKHSE